MKCLLAIVSGLLLCACHYKPTEPVGRYQLVAGAVADKPATFRIDTQTGVVDLIEQLPINSGGTMVLMNEVPPPEQSSAIMRGLPVGN